MARAEGPRDEKPGAVVITCVRAAAAGLGPQKALSSCGRPPEETTPGRNPSLYEPSLATPSSQPLPHHGPTLPTPATEPLPGRRKNHRASSRSLERPRAVEPRPDQPKKPGDALAGCQLPLTAKPGLGRDVEERPASPHLQTRPRGKRGRKTNI